MQLLFGIVNSMFHFFSDPQVNFKNRLYVQFFHIDYMFSFSIYPSYASEFWKTKFCTLNFLNTYDLPFDHLIG